MLTKEKMTKQEVFEVLKTEFNKIVNLSYELTEYQIFQKPTKECWSIAENIQHLILATKPLVQLFSNPDVMATNWRKSNRASKKYNEVIELYLKHIGIPGFTTKNYTPIDMKLTKSELIQNFYIMNENLIDKAALLSEEDLDSYQIPHPLIGLMTCREFLYFTHFHTAHHFNAMKKGIENNEVIKN